MNDTGWAGRRLPVGDLLPLNFNLRRRCCCHVDRLSQTANSSILPSNKLCALCRTDTRPPALSLSLYSVPETTIDVCLTIRKSVCSNSPRAGSRNIPTSPPPTAAPPSFQVPPARCRVDPNIHRTPPPPTPPPSRLNRSLPSPHRSPHSKPIARDLLPTPAVLPARAGFRRQPPQTPPPCLPPQTRCPTRTR